MFIEHHNKLNAVMLHTILSVSFSPNKTGSVYILFILSPEMSAMSNNISLYKEPTNNIWDASANTGKFLFITMPLAISDDNPVNNNDIDTKSEHDIFFINGILFNSGVYRYIIIFAIVGILRKQWGMNL